MPWILSTMHPKWGTSQKLIFNLDVYSQKSRIRETQNLSTDADISTDATVGWTENTQKNKQKIITEKMIQNRKTLKRLEVCQNQLNTLQPEVSNPSGSIVCTIFCKAKSAKNKLFCATILDHIPTKMFDSETTSFQHFFPWIPNL